MMSRNQGRVHCKLCPTEQREAFRNNFYAAPIVHLWCQNVQITHMHVSRNASASLTANSCANALKLQTPVCPEPLLYCTLRVAKRIEWTATRAGARDKGQRQMVAAQQKHTEQKAVNPGCIMGRCGHQCCTRQWTTLGSQRGLFILAQPALKELTMSALNPGRRLVLPPSFCATRIILLNVSTRWANTFGQCDPRWGFEPFHPHQTLPCITCRCQRCTRCASFQLINNGSGHNGVAGTDHGAQLAQKAEALVRAALRRPNPPIHNGKDATSLANSSH